VSIIAVDAWKEVQNKIVTKIGTQRFNLWLKNTILKSIDDETAVIGVPNTFILTWIEERLAGEVKAALGEVVKREVEVKFVVDGSLFRQMRDLQAGQQDEAITLRGPSGATHTDCQAFNPRFTYERYVVGKCNRFAYEMSRQLIDARGTQFNALLIYGGVGLGKSHLLQAFAREFSRRYPELGVRYVTCEQFVNRFVTAVRQNKLDSFRRLHRGVDALVIDDIHWLAEKKASQEEFLHTFNTLADRNRIIIAASDSHPSQMKKISRALMDRFAAGMTARIDPPDRETRVGIINKRAAEMRRKLDAAIAGFLADSCAGNTRELEGNLMKLFAFHSLNKKPLTVSLARTVLDEGRSPRRERISLEKIQEAVCDALGTTPREMNSSRRTRSVAMARQVAMYLARKLTAHSLNEVGRFFGNKSHATALHAEAKIKRMVSANPSLAEQVGKIEDAVCSTRS
jgi:chromosomal replication initiator protein